MTAPHDDSNGRVDPAAALRGVLARRVVMWQRRYGRNDLPWQHPIDPYRVWLSEVMLQQTQVATVLPYFARAVQRWPDVNALANADEADVLGLWSGLGYYSRARNLHSCARVIVTTYSGVFPRTASELGKLPGIGPSTAAAIASICFGERVAILDGNVKRVLARVLAFTGDLNSPLELRTLHAHASELLPKVTRGDAQRRYTQGLMDLGATICVPRTPLCSICPLAGLCAARAQGIAETLPRKPRRGSRKRQDWWLLALRGLGHEVALVKRPARGIWGGMLALPAFEDEPRARAALLELEAHLLRVDPPLQHALTHLDLHLHVVHARLSPTTVGLPDRHGLLWQDAGDVAQAPLPTPIARILRQIAAERAMEIRETLQN